MRISAKTWAMVPAVIWTLSACRGKAEPTETPTAPTEFEDTEAVTDGVQRMRPYRFADTLRADGHLYAYTILREASDSLPVVMDEEGITYADNVYTLTIQRDGHPFFERRFTKGSFASYLSPEVRRNGLLDGMICDSSLPGLAFAVSVSLPQSDLLDPLLLHVDGTGGIAIERDTRSENDFEE